MLYYIAQDSPTDRHICKADTDLKAVFEKIGTDWLRSIISFASSGKRMGLGNGELF